MIPREHAVMGKMDPVTRMQASRQVFPRCCIHRQSTDSLYATGNLPRVPKTAVEVYGQVLDPRLDID